LPTNPKAKKKRKRAFPPELSHCCHDTQTQSFSRCRGSHFIQKEKKNEKNKTKKVFVLDRDHPSPMQMNLFRLSEDVPLVVVVVVVLVPSFFSCKWIPNLLARARTHTHPKARKTNDSGQEEQS
jgi:hypothetical protein